MENINLTYPYNPTTDPYQYVPVTKIIKRVTKTIDKYDREGVFIGREIITEEYEDVEKQVWEQQKWWVSDGTFTYPADNNNITVSFTNCCDSLCIN